MIKILFYVRINRQKYILKIILLDFSINCEAINHNNHVWHSSICSLDIPWCIYVIFSTTQTTPHCKNRVWKQRICINFHLASSYKIFSSEYYNNYFFSLLRTEKGILQEFTMNLCKSFQLVEGWASRKKFRVKCVIGTRHEKLIT